MRLQIFQVDAFTSKPFAGNPAAVVPLDAWLPDETMLAIAAENNLAETAFFVKNGDRYEIRWFTPKVEVDLCGHATLASAYVLFEILKADDSSIRFDSKSGELLVERDGERLVLNFPALPAGAVDVPSDLADALGGRPERILKAKDYLVIYQTEQEIVSLAPDFRALSKTDARGVIVSARGDSVDFVSRFFAPGAGIDEDPVTGSAHCTLIPFWANALGKDRLHARQISARGGELFCELAGDRVKIGGNATLYMKGEIYVEVDEPKSVGA